MQYYCIFFGTFARVLECVFSPCLVTAKLTEAPQAMTWASLIPVTGVGSLFSPASFPRPRRPYSARPRLCTCPVDEVSSWTSSDEMHWWDTWFSASATNFHTSITNEVYGWLAFWIQAHCVMLPARETHPGGGGVLERTEFQRNKAGVCALGA